MEITLLAQRYLIKTGRNVYFETRTVKETIETPVFATKKDEKGNEYKDANVILKMEKKEVDKQISVPMENGKEVKDRLLVSYNDNSIKGNGNKNILQEYFRH